MMTEHYYRHCEPDEDSVTLVFSDESGKEVNINLSWELFYVFISSLMRALDNTREVQMISIHSYELVHEEPAGVGDVLILLYDQLRGGSFYVLLRKGWFIHELIHTLEAKRCEQGLIR